MMRSLLFACLLTLAGCAGVAPVSPDLGGDGQDPAVAWAERQQALSRLDHFRLVGRLSVVRGVESWFINVEWQQRGSDWLVVLSGPFGAGLRLSGAGGGPVVLENSEGRFHADSAEQLLYQHTGVVMPLTGLRYWMLGLPDPRLAVDGEELDDRGRLRTLHQADWRIRLRRYVAINGLELPDKVFADQGELKVRLIVDEWYLGLG
ncbi:MAG TPA: outer membrane lipoprotein LolB [Gammaproteobacteria bacterium]|nr:outer membrane lipoprotein LolB [Gammaproteobacteria bacterium]